MQRNFCGILGALALCLLALPLGAAPHGDDAVRVDGLTFETWEDYAASDYFKSSERRCATPNREVREQLYGPPTLPLDDPGLHLPVCHPDRGRHRLVHALSRR